MKWERIDTGRQKRRGSVECMEEKRRCENMYEKNVRIGEEKEHWKKVAGKKEELWEMVGEILGEEGGVVESWLREIEKWRKGKWLNEKMYGKVNGKKRMWIEV